MNSIGLSRRASVVIDDGLMNEALELTQLKEKKDALEGALKLYI